MAKNPNPSLLDQGQIIKRVFNDDDDSLRVDATITANISDAQEVIVSDLDDSIKIGDGTGDYLAINTDGSIKTVQIFTKPFDAITATYPSGTQEVYNSRVGGISGTIQETVTINYTDSTKNLILNVART